MFTAKELAKAIGRTGLYRVGQMEFTVKIVDVRQVFSRVDVLIRPIMGQGHGEAWVASTSIRLNDQDGRTLPMHSYFPASEVKERNQTIGTCAKCARPVHDKNNAVWTCRHNLSPANQFYIKNDLDMESHDVAGCVHSMPLHGACYDTGNY